MEVRRRVKRLLAIAKPKYVPPPPKVSKELASLEALAHHQRWLRGVLCLLSFVSFAFSLVAIEDFRVVFFCGCVVLGASIVGEICVFRVYQIKAMHAGVTNPIYEAKASVLHSPHFFSMLLEMFVWMLHCPPGMARWINPALVNLDFLVVLRFYSILLYLNNLAFGQRTFCRAMSAIADIPLNVSYYLRTSFVFDSAKTSLAVLTVGWCALALLFAKSEGLGFWDSMYFCFVTAATIGYGDITAKTTPGRFVAFFSWIFGLTVVGWVVGLTHEALALSDPERNLFTLFQANELCNRIPREAAKVIQRAYRLHAARRRSANIMTQNWLGYKLTTQVNLLRSERRRLRSTEVTFMTEMSAFENVEPPMDDMIGLTSKRTPKSSLSPKSNMSTSAEDVSMTTIAAPRKAAVPSVSDRIAALEKNIDELILVAESLVRQRCSREDSRVTETAQ